MLGVRCRFLSQDSPGLAHYGGDGGGCNKIYAGARAYGSQGCPRGHISCCLRWQISVSHPCLSCFWFTRRSLHLACIVKPWGFVGALEWYALDWASRKSGAEPEWQDALWNNYWLGLDPTAYFRSWRVASSNKTVAPHHVCVMQAKLGSGLCPPFRHALWKEDPCLCACLCAAAWGSVWEDAHRGTEFHFPECEWWVGNRWLANLACCQIGLLSLVNKKHPTSVGSTAQLSSVMTSWRGRKIFPRLWWRGVWGFVQLFTRPFVTEN